MNVRSNAGPTEREPKYFQGNAIFELSGQAQHASGTLGLDGLFQPNLRIARAYTLTQPKEPQRR